MKSGTVNDWLPLLGGLAALLTAAGGVWAVMSGAFRQKETNQSARDEQTLNQVWKLVQELQEERTRAADRIGVLEQRVAGLEDKIRSLESDLRRSQDEVADLKRQLEVKNQ